MSIPSAESKIDLRPESSEAVMVQEETGVGRMNFVVMNFVGAKDLLAMQKPIHQPPLNASPLRTVFLGENGVAELRPPNQILGVRAEIYEAEWKQGWNARAVARSLSVRRSARSTL